MEDRRKEKRNGVTHHKRRHHTSEKEGKRYSSRKATSKNTASKKKIEKAKVQSSSRLKRFNPESSDWKEFEKTKKEMKRFKEVKEKKEKEKETELKQYREEVERQMVQLEDEEEEELERAKLRRLRRKSQRKEECAQQNIIVDKERGEAETLAQSTPKQTKEDIDTKPDVAATEEKPEDCDMKDMFDLAEEETLDRKVSNSSLERKGDICDDPDGFYILRSGEVLDQRYKVLGFQGKGVFSSVFLAKDLQSNEERSIKIIRNNDVMRRTGQRELQVLRGLQKKDPAGAQPCVRFHGHFEHRGHLCLVFEALSLNLRQLLRRCGSNGLRTSAVRCFASQLLQALAFLRRGELVHADVKPDNILVDSTRRKVRLCDFGSAFDTKSVTLTPYLCSRYYRPPEIVLGCDYGFAVDMWSLGCVLFELYSGQILFKGETNNAMLLQFIQLFGRLPSKLLKHGAFSADHFDQNSAFLCLQIDAVTGAEYRKPMGSARATGDLLEKMHPPQIEPFDGLGDECKKEVRHLKDLLEKCLKLDPAKRITPAEALQHAFIRDYPAQ